MTTLSLRDLGFVGGLTPATLWTPAQTTTALWLDAADASTVSTVSSAASQWNDKSGNNRNLAQSTSSNRPLYLTNQVNGLSALSFDGINDVMSNSSVGLPVGASARTMFTVYSPLRTTGSQGICGQGTVSASGGWFMFYAFNGGPAGFAGYSADLPDSTATTLSTKIAVMNYTGTAGTLKRDGSVIASGNLSLNTQGNAFRIGQAPDVSAFANILLCEIVMLSASANLATEQLMEGYLAWKWGVQGSLPANHPYKSAAPTI